MNSYLQLEEDRWCQNRPRKVKSWLGSFENREEQGICRANGNSYDHLRGPIPWYPVAIVEKIQKLHGPGIEWGTRWILRFFFDSLPTHDMSSDPISPPFSFKNRELFGWKRNWFISQFLIFFINQTWEKELIPFLYFYFTVPNIP